MRTLSPERLSLEKWRGRIQSSISDDHLLLIVAAYLGAWTDEELSRAASGPLGAIRSIGDLHNLAIDLVQKEVNFKGAAEDWPMLRDLALVISTAAARARYLESLKVG